MSLPLNIQQPSRPESKKSKKRYKTTYNDKVVKRASEMPILYKSCYLRAMTGKNRPAAVKSFCLECVGWVRDEVTNCTATACPLYLYRPYQRKKVNNE